MKDICRWLAQVSHRRPQPWPMLAWGPRDSGPMTDAQHCVNTSMLQFTSFPVCWAPGEGDQCQQEAAQSEIWAQVRTTFLCAGAHKSVGNGARQAENTLPGLAEPARRQICPEPLGSHPRQARILHFLARKTGVPPQGAADRKSTKNQPGLGNFRGRGEKRFAKIFGSAGPPFFPRARQRQKSANCFWTS